MKGFGIYVKNELLDPKHQKAMGEAVWLYLWLLDKMTSITEEGVGNVLGGRPIISDEVRDELGVSDRTYRRWLLTLHTAGYVNVKRAPAGLVLSVNKAEKIFGNKGSATSDRSDRPHLTKGSATSDRSDRPHLTKGSATSDRSNRDSTIDNTMDNTKGSTPLDQMISFLYAVQNGTGLYAEIVKRFTDKGWAKTAVEAEMEKFVLYWTEPNRSGTKQKWELERTFEINRRLVTWFNNAARFGGVIREPKKLKEFVPDGPRTPEEQRKIDEKLKELRGKKNLLLKNVTMKQ